MIRPTSILFGLLLTVQALGQTSSQKAAVPLSAVVQKTPARITLSWTTLASTTSITIYRKLKTATSWGSALAYPAASALQYQDDAVLAGTAYEYRVVRVAGGVTGQGYICTGIEVPLSDYKGKILLLVDNTFTSSLATELTQLQQDLRADGWAVLRSDVSRTAAVTSVRNTVIAQYNTDPSNMKAVFIIGHVPVPYSGNINPDGHSEHLGAWPCDGYYGEMNGTWTDNTVNNNASQRVENRNTPGDGKFDQSTFPSDLELQVGRVDMFDMPAFTLNETELLRAYLVKAHNYKIKQWTPTPRGIIFDNLQWISNPIAGSGWRGITPLVGAANITAPNVYAGNFNTLINNQSYLWSYNSGGGLQAYEGSTLTFNGADLVGTTQIYAGMAGGSVFNMTFGSYYGDWDNRNNFLRAPLASGSGLANCFVGIPAWYFHHMGLGDNIGYSTLVTMNNTSLYTPLTEGWQSTMGKTHLALMGDPSLRLKMLAPPTNLAITNAAGLASFSWTAAPGSVDGYHLYRFDAATGAITRLTANPVTTTTYSNGAIPFVAGTEYMVRAVKLQVEPGGSYLNLSLGAIAASSGVAQSDCLGVAGGPALPGTACNDGSACTINDLWNASCQCVGTSITPTAVITPGGATGFCTGGSVVLNASTGTGYTYVWKKNGATISGATSSSYTSTQAGTYTVVVTNSGCSSTSNAIVVTVTAVPTAAISAAGATTFCTGGSVTLNATTGTGYTYVWKKNGTAISGATSSSYVASQAGSYTVTVSNVGCSASSSAIAVVVNTAPSATVTAGGTTSLCTGGSVVFTSNTGTGYTYVWKKNGTTISGATSSTYTATQAGSYTVTVSNDGCSTTSSAQTVTVSAAPAATISAGGATTFCPGGQVLLTANTGTGYTYVWKLGGTTIAGATSNTYTATQAGSYTVTVANGGCSTTSSALVVTVNTPPTVTCSSNVTNATVSVTATGGLAPYTYAWNTVPVVTTATMTVTASGNYTVSVTDARGCRSSCTSSITLAPPPNSCDGIRTESQAAWGATASGSNPAAYMVSNFAAAFPAPNYLMIGCGSRTLKLTTASAVTAFLPSTGSAAQLPVGTTQNPGSAYHNKFAGQLVALKLSVRFDELDAAFSSSTVLLKDMIIASGTFSGWTVQQLITAADSKIGSCGGSYSRGTLNTAITAINKGYRGGTMNSGYLICPGASEMMVQTGVDQEGVDPLEEGLDVSIFPNPVRGMATFVITGATGEQPTTVELYSLSGVLVGRLFNGLIPSGMEQRVQWDADPHATGMYFYRVVSGDRIATGKLLVE